MVEVAESEFVGRTPYFVRFASDVVASAGGTAAAVEGPSETDSADAFAAVEHAEVAALPSTRHKTTSSKHRIQPEVN